MPDPMILVDPGVLEPQGRPFWTTPEMAPPTFVSGTVARVFFGRSPSWLKVHIHDGHHLDENGQDLRPLRTPAGYYDWRLYDIERFAHNLARQRLIRGRHLELVIQIVRAVANLYDHKV